jgi:hypothetical protein
MRREQLADAGQMTLDGGKLTDDIKFTHTELKIFDVTPAEDLTEPQLVTRCSYIQYGVCHIDHKGTICKGLCERWFTKNIPLIKKLSNKVSKQHEGVGIDTAAHKIEWVHAKMLRK